MIISVKIRSAGSDSGPFDIYSNSTGSFVLVQSNVSKAVLLQGYTMTVPDGTTVVRVESKGECTNYEDIIVDLITTTTTSTTTIAPTTTTTTAAPTTTTTTTAAPSSDYRQRSYVIDNKINQVECDSATYYDYIEAVKFELTELDGITPKVNTTGADIVVNMQFDTIECFGSGSFYRDVIIPPGQSSTNAENRGITNNCGGTGCVTETEIMSCYTSIVPNTVQPTGDFYPICAPTTTTTSTTTQTPSGLCTYYEAVVDENDLAQAQDGNVYFVYQDCDGVTQTSVQSNAGTFLNAFCATGFSGTYIIVNNIQNIGFSTANYTAQACGNV
jgi:hypothetical protein